MLGGQEVYRDSVSAWTLHFLFALECVWRVQGRIRRRSVWIVSLLMSLLSWLRSCVWPFMGAPVCQTYAPPVNRSAPRTIMDALNIIHATLLHNMWCTHHYMCHTCIINDEPTVNIARNRKEKIGATLHSGFASNPLFRWCENNIFWTLGSNQAILGCPNVSCPA